MSFFKGWYLERRRRGSPLPTPTPWGRSGARSRMGRGGAVRARGAFRRGEADAGQRTGVRDALAGAQEGW